MLKLPRALLGSMAFAAMLIAPSGAQAAGGFWQCAPFARMFSGIQLFGNAAGWWAQAVGKYAQGQRPKLGSVLVFKAFGSMRVGHVATVSRIVSDRLIKVTHANWSLINGRKGQVERDVTVVDASDAGDWSKVKVWYGPIRDVGRTAYPTFGFIYADGAAPTTDAAVAAAS